MRNERIGVNARNFDIPPTGDSGLLSNAADMARFGQPFLDGGKTGSVQVLKPETLKTGRNLRSSVAPSLFLRFLRICH